MVATGLRRVLKDSDRRLADGRLGKWAGAPLGDETTSDWSDPHRKAADENEVELSHLVQNLTP